MVIGYSILFYINKNCYDFLSDIIDLQPKWIAYDKINSFKLISIQRHEDYNFLIKYQKKDSTKFYHWVAKYFSSPI